MSEVARQYNLIGETLRQGVGDLLQGQAAGKALDLQALRMGIQGEESKSTALHRDRQFKAQQKATDENARRYDQQRKDPSFQIQQQTAQAKLDEHNQWATDFSMGVDTDWEKELLKMKWQPEMEKVGYERRDDGSWWKEGKRMKHGEMKMDSDIAGIMLANMDPSVHVRKQYEIENEVLKDMAQSIKDGTAGPNEEATDRMFDQQKQLVKSLDNQLIDMEHSPIKYLNAQIDSLGDLMTGSLNPGIHALKYKEIVDRRNGLVEQQTKMAEAAGKTTNLFKVHLYDSQGDIVFTDWLRKGESPMQSKKFQDFIVARKAEKLDTYYDVPQSVKRANQAAVALLGNPAMKGVITQKFFSEGFDSASDAFRSVFNAAQSAAGGQIPIHDEYNQIQNNFRAMGTNMFDGSVNFDNQEHHENRVLDWLKKQNPNMTPAEIDKRAAVYFSMLDTASAQNPNQ